MSMITAPKTVSVGDRFTLFHIKTDRFKAGQISVSAVLPVTREDAPKTSLLLSVLRRGTIHYPSLAALNLRLDYLYGTGFGLRNFFRGDSQVIGFSADLLGKNYLPDCKDDLMAGVLELMAEILFHPLSDENGLLLSRYVESEKQLQCDAIKAQKNNPRAYAADRCRDLLYRNEPCGAPIYGTEEDTMKITPEELTAHWKKLLSDLTLYCFYVGPEEEDTVCRAVTDAFGSYLPKQAPQKLPQTVVIRRAESVAEKEEELEVTQGHLAIAYRTGTVLGEPDYYACSVFNELLGVSPISKLFMNVREKRSLCYSVSSSYRGYKGTLMVLCSMDPANRAKAEEEIFRQISEVQNGNFSEEELTAAKKSLLNAYSQLEDSPSALQSFYFGRSLIGCTDTPTDCRNKIQAVTKAQVVEAANRLTLDTVYFLKGTLMGEGGEADEED